MYVPDVYIIFRPPYWGNNEVLQRGDSIRGSIILRGKFRRISQFWNNSHNLILANCLLYLSSKISQFLDFIRSMYMILFFIAWLCTHSINRQSLQGVNKMKQTFRNIPSLEQSSETSAFQSVNFERKAHITISWLYPLHGIWFYFLLRDCAHTR